MRVRLIPSTSTHVAFAIRYLARGTGTQEAIDRLRHNAQRGRMWSGVDVGVDMPVVLWGVVPHDRERRIGFYWMLGLGSVGRLEPDELVELTRLVVEEMLDEFDRIENWVDAADVSSLTLLGKAGFTIEAATPEVGSPRLHSLAWVERLRRFDPDPSSP